jgi:nucleoside-diphosphate-sugar epimerase
MPHRKGLNIKILVTGATGFIGRNLVKNLNASGHNVVACLRKNHMNQNVVFPPDVKLIEWDHSVDLENAITDLKIDVIVHLATLYSTSDDFAEVLKMVDGITKTSLNIMGTAAKKSIPLVFTNSFSTSISRQGKPGSIYALLKSFDHEIATYMSNEYGLRVIELSLFDTYGPSDERSKFLTELIKSVSKGEEFIASGGKQLIDLTHVDDICSVIEKATLKVLEPNFESMQSYSVTSQNPLTLEELSEIVFQVLKKKVKIEWGGRPYRKHEMFTHRLLYPPFPDWQPKKFLNDGVNEMYEQLIRAEVE